MFFFTELVSLQSALLADIHQRWVTGNLLMDPISAFPAAVCLKLSCNICNDELRLLLAVPKRVPTVVIKIPFGFVQKILAWKLISRLTKIVHERRHGAVLVE